MLKLTAVLILFTCGCAGNPSRQISRPLVEESPLRIIDAHTHIEAGGFEEGKDRSTVLKDYFSEWEKAGVVGSVVHTRDLTEKNYFDTGDRNVIQCAGLGVRGALPYAQLDHELTTGKFKCIKIYLGYVKKFADDPSYQRVYQIAKKHHVPVVFHTGDVSFPDGELKYADPLTIDHVAVQHRDVKFVIAHCGNPWIESAAEVAYKNENVYLDGSGFLTGEIDQLSPEKVEDYLVKPLRWVFGYVENPDKLMYGSDWSLTRTAPYIAAFKRAIPREYWQKVFHDNAVKVFGMRP